MPAKAWCQSLQGWLNGRYREQAQLPQFFRVFARSACHRQSPVGAGLPAKAWCQSLQCWLNGRHREQAQLPQFFGCSQDRHATANPCGSGFAREGVVSVTSRLAERTPSRASSAPTVFRVFGCSQDRHATANPCGSGLAREGVVSVTSRLAERTPSRASSAPTVFRVFGCSQDRHATANPLCVNGH